MAITFPPVTPGLDALDPLRPGGVAPGERATPGAQSFGDVLGQALQGVEKLQVAGDKSAEELALGGGNLHETALALEKADTAMRVALKVRNKLVDAYQDIMRMTI